MTTAKTSKNVTINVTSGECLVILNSNVSSIIQNITTHLAYDPQEEAFAIKLENCNNTIIRNSYVNTNSSCIAVFSTNNPCHNITIANNTIYRDTNQAGSGIVFDVRDINSNLEIYGNNFTTFNITHMFYI